MCSEKDGDTLKLPSLHQVFEEEETSKLMCSLPCHCTALPALPTHLMACIPTTFQSSRPPSSQPQPQTTTQPYPARFVSALHSPRPFSCGPLP